MTEFEELDQGRWRDVATGLVLVEAPAHALHRVFETTYGPLNPPIPHDDRALWSRFDSLDAVTVYGASSELGALLESLAAFKYNPIDLSDIFPDLKGQPDPVAREWAELGHMPPGGIARVWRVGRQLTKVRLQPQATTWYVDLLHSETIAALRENARRWSPAADLVLDPLQIDTSLLTGPNRRATTAVADWLRSQVLSDGREPDGVIYRSKHGHDLDCWATWIPLLGTTAQDEVPDLVGEYFMSDDGCPIPEGHPSLQQAARMLGLRVH